MWGEEKESLHPLGDGLGDVNGFSGYKFLIGSAAPSGGRSASFLFTSCSALFLALATRYGLHGEEAQVHVNGRSLPPQLQCPGVTSLSPLCLHWKEPAMPPLHAVCGGTISPLTQQLQDLTKGNSSIVTLEQACLTLRAK